MKPSKLTALSGMITTIVPRGVIPDGIFLRARRLLIYGAHAGSPATRADALSMMDGNPDVRPDIAAVVVRAAKKKRPRRCLRA